MNDVRSESEGSQLTLALNFKARLPTSSARPVFSRNPSPQCDNISEHVFESFTMALPLHPGLTPNEVGFLCEMELVTVIPRQRLDALELLGVSTHTAQEHRCWRPFNPTNYTLNSKIHRAAQKV